MTKCHGYQYNIESAALQVTNSLYFFVFLYQIAFPDFSALILRERFQKSDFLRDLTGRESSDQLRTQSSLHLLFLLLPLCFCTCSDHQRLQDHPGRQHIMIAPGICFDRCLLHLRHIQDDILDVTSTSEALGKPVLSDEKNQKTTYVTLVGLEQAKKNVEEISARAVSLLKELPGNNAFLENLIAMLVERKK